MGKRITEKNAQAILHQEIEESFPLLIEVETNQRVLLSKSIMIIYERIDV
jgi:hypothetical protein